MRRLSLILALLPLVVPTAARAASVTQAPPVVGQVNEYELGLGTRPTALVTGPDGNLWFAGIRYVSGGFTDVLGKVTPQGRVSEFELGTHSADVGLSDIAVGPDGNLWFTEGGRTKVGRITTAGQITEFDLPQGAGSTTAIAAGPDGNVWFTESGANRIGRITPSGQVTEFPLKGHGNSGAATSPPVPTGRSGRRCPERGRSHGSGPTARRPTSTCPKKLPPAIRAGSSSVPTGRSGSGSRAKRRSAASPPAAKSPSSPCRRAR